MSGKKELKRLIRESVKTGEYMIAHFHAEAIGYVNRNLQTLRNLDDKNADNKRFVRDMIRRLENHLEKRPIQIKDFLKSEIEGLKKEQKQLEQQAQVSVPESLIFTRHLESLISENIRQIRLHLKRSAKFILEISKPRAGIKIQIKNLKVLRRKHIFYDEKLTHFLGLNFTLDKYENKLTLLIIGQDSKKLLSDVQIIISKIVFEIYYFKEFEGDTCIEIIKK